VSNPLYGQILVDANGMTLYYFAKDTPGAGTSVCTLGCPGAWPPFDAVTVRVSPPLQASDFGTITRPDGTKQTSYRGWPLYRYASDAAAGDTKGHGINGFWYVMSPTGVVTLAPTTTVPTTVRTTAPPYYGGGGY
jgi:predicted lipoprotein with Yx(FWY)xxD motif